MTAVHLPEARVLAGDYASPRGRFALKAPGGSYALLVSVIPKRGSQPPLERVADFVTVAPGKRVALRPTLRSGRRRAAKRRGRAIARAAFQRVSHLALWVRRWSVPPGELRVYEKGMADMLITDLSPAVARCGGGIYDRDAWDVLLREQRLQQDPRFDPASRVEMGRLVIPNATVEGRMTVSGSTMTLTARFHDERTGRSGTAVVTGPADALFDNEQALVRKLERLVCEQTTQTYEGTFDGTATSRLNQYTISWSGSVTIELQSEHGSAPSGWPGQRAPALPVAAVQVDPGGDDEPWFSLGIPATATAVVPYRETGFGCQTDPQYPLTGIQLAYTPRPLRATG